MRGGKQLDGGLRALGSDVDGRGYREMPSGGLSRRSGSKCRERVRVVGKRRWTRLRGHR